jgi:large subunit ribosomal protein L6
MSKIGKLPITVKEGVNVTVQGRQVSITAPKGAATYQLPEGFAIDVADSKVTVKPPTQMTNQMRALYGLTRANLANILKGLDTGFEKKLELTGVGYRAQMQGNDLVLSLGFSHQVRFSQPEGITISVADNGITIAGADKTRVGQIAAQIRAVRPPEPYKGKGIKYKGEKIRRKAGKAAKAAGAK